MRETYRFERLADIADRMVNIHMGESVTPDYPVIGERAYRYLDPGFAQVAGRPCDLPPEWIGRTAGYRVTPGWAPTWVIGKRLEELGYPPEVFGDDDLLRAMRLRMAEACLDGEHVEFDRPEKLAELVEACAAGPRRAAE